MQPEGQEIVMEENELIVSKTDRKGRIVYCNKLCADIAEYKQQELGPVDVHLSSIIVAASEMKAVKL